MTTPTPAPAPVHPGLECYELIPAPIAATWPERLQTRSGRRFTARLLAIEKRLAGELAKHGDWLGEIQFDRRHGSIVTELAGAIALLAQIRATADTAIDRRILQQRRTLAAVGRRAVTIRRRAHGALAGKGGLADD